MCVQYSGRVEADVQQSCGMAPGAGVTHTADLCASCFGQSVVLARRLFNLVCLVRVGAHAILILECRLFSQAARMEATAAAFDAQLKAFLTTAAATVTA